MRAWARTRRTGCACSRVAIKLGRDWHDGFTRGIGSTHDFWTYRGSSRNRTCRGLIYGQPCLLDSSTPSAGSGHLSCCAVRQQDSRASPALAACLVCIRGLTLGGERCDTEMSDGARVVSPGIGWRRCARVRNTVVKTPSARKRRGVIGSTHDFWTYRALSSLQTSHGFNRGRAVSRGSRLTIFSMGCRAAPGLAPGRSLGFRCAHAAVSTPCGLLTCP